MMTKSRLGILLVCLLAKGFLWGGATGAVKGLVKDAASGAPLAEVKITLVSSASEALKYELHTDKKGGFYKSGLTPGIYKALLEKAGYLPLEVSFRIQLDDTANLEIRLDQAQGAPAASSELIRNGPGLLEAGKYDEIIARAGEAIAADPLNPVYYYYRAVALERKGDAEKALEDYQKAAELKPNFITPLSRAAAILGKKGDFEKAVEFFRKATDLGTQDPSTYYNFGVCLVNLRRNSEAQAIFDKLLGLDPSFADAHYQLGIIYVGLGDAPKAKEHLLKFIEMDPENKNAPLAKEILKTMKEPSLGKALGSSPHAGVHLSSRMPFRV
jgi:tetratricopeptide (TPR) repeat protein